MYAIIVPGIPSLMLSEVFLEPEAFKELDGALPLLLIKVYLIFKIVLASLPKVLFFRSELHLTVVHPDSQCLEALTWTAEIEVVLFY